MDELVIDNLVYIPSRRAAEITGYAKDYVGQLCREGRIEAKLVGRSWYVLESSIREHRFGVVASGAPMEVAEPATKEPEVVAEETPVAEEELMDEQVTDDSLSTWKPATYTTEEADVLEESRQTTYLENTSSEEIEEKTQTSQVQEVQNAWQEWFSKNEHVQVGKDVSDTLVEEEAVEEQESAPEPVMIRKASAVRIEEEEESAPMVSFDNIQPVAVSQVRREKRGPSRSFQTQRPAGRVLKAVFIGVIIVTLAVTVIGTGSLDAISPSWASKGSVIEYLAGVQNFSK